MTILMVMLHQKSMIIMIMHMRIRDHPEALGQSTLKRTRRKHSFNTQRSTRARGGTDLPKNDKIFRKLKLTGIFRCSFMFKNRGKFWFLSKSSFDPPYMGSENFDHFR